MVFPEKEALVARNVEPNTWACCQDLFLPGTTMIRRGHGNICVFQEMLSAEKKPLLGTMTSNTLAYV